MRSLLPVLYVLANYVNLGKSITTAVSAEEVRKIVDDMQQLHNDSSFNFGVRKMPSASQLNEQYVKWPQHHCRRHGKDLSACSRQFAHEAVTCIGVRQMCDGTKNCPYGDDEDPTRCLFHRLSMDEMNRIRLAFSHLMEKGKRRKQPIVWKDDEGKVRDQNGDFVA
ncbi:unnamed protein product [Nippostrongylus brasiliensis]|uniref:Secreted protein n=1 Tax=Nippostrongylus brasiliensis TaxID=27835 RepID=A0A0N4XZE2_NIPBR|nr:hypothetical protein Q1695_000920 [Nippostrongylus brasiliensis]VDL72128.1 unnamed protein product [Nippostrongylus brasiliensis]